MSVAETTSSICLSVLCIYMMTAPSPPPPSSRPGTASSPPPRPTRVAYANAAESRLEILPSGETQTKPVGSSIILTCKPNVDQPSLVENMQWFDPQDHVIETFNMYAGGHTKPTMYTELHQDHSLSLFFNSLQEEQAGRYTCKGNYARSVALNKSVTIDTIIAITWDNAPLNQYPILGEDFAIQCQVRARPSPSVSWIHNDQVIQPNDTHYVIDTYFLKIKNVQESDDGIYICRASVAITGELKERPIRVEVHIRPKIEEVSTPVDIIEGENANIECKASGKPPPMVSWIKSLTQQNLSAADRFGVDPVTGALTVTNVNREDAGEYQCTAMNAAGSTSANILVNVIVKPKIMEFENKTVVQGKDVEIVCKAFGRPPPEVSFRKLTAEKPYVMGLQPNDDRITVANDPKDVSRDETCGILSIRKALTSNDGLYECVAKNVGGVARRNGHLIVEYPPSFRSMPNVTVWSWEQRQVNLTCIAESIPNATIRWTMRGEEKVENDAMIQQIGNGPISILAVVPINRRYYTSYKCIAANPHGTREHIIELREATKPGDLLEVNMAQLTATSIRFNLTPPAHPDLPIRTISVQYKEENEMWTIARNKTWSVGSLYVIENLKPQTSYDFRFAARNEVGLGDWGTYYRHYTPSRTVPNRPKIVTSSSFNEEYDVSKYHNQYELSWLTPDSNGEPIDMYQIKYCQLRPVSGDWETLQNTCVDTNTQGRTKHWLRNLDSDTFYIAQLQAHNIMGYSESGFLKFKTARESTGFTVDYTVVSAGGDTRKIAVAAITTAVMLLSLAI